MTTSEQFARACNQLEGDVDKIEIIIDHDLDRPAYIKADRWKFGYSLMTVICDKEMHVAGWRQFGKSIRASDTIKTLCLRTVGPFQGVTPGIARCMQAFFDEVKENKTIEKFSLYFDVCTAIPALDLRYFFQNDQSLDEVSLSTNRDHVSLAQSTHLLTALRDLSLKKIIIGPCQQFTNNGAFDQVLFACQKMKELRLRYFRENYQFSTIANLLRDPMTSLQKLYLKIIDRKIIDRLIPNFDMGRLENQIRRLENEILASLTQNVNLQVLAVHGFFQEVLAVHGFFQDGLSKEHTKQVLCNTTSIEGIIRSNHSLRSIIINYEEEDISDEEEETGEFEAPWQQYLALNENPNKKKVIQAKINLN